MSVRAGAWLAVRELRARWPRMLLAAAVVAALSGAAVTMELLARAREEVVAARIDSMGPPLTIVPAGTTAEALGRYDLGEALLPSRAAADAAAELGPALRLVEARLVLGTMMEGRRVPLVGLPRGRWPGDLPPASGILAGAELGRSMPVGTSVPLGAGSLAVARVAAPAGSIDDVAMFVPLEVAQRVARTTAVNEMRVYLRAGVSPEDAERRLRRAIAGAAVIRHDRGSVAGSEAQASLAAHRGAAYAMLAGVALLCLLIAAHLDAAERRVELATLVAIGTPSAGILSALLLRSVFTGAAGAAFGAVLGMGLAVTQDPLLSSAWPRWWHVGAVAVGCAAAVAALASLGVGIAALLRDPVADLQEA